MIETMIASTILVLILGAVIMFNLWGLSMATRSQIYLASGDDSRNALRMLTQDVRTAYSGNGGGVSVGSGTDAPSFIPVAATNLQVGNALMIKPSTNPVTWIIYYYQTNKQQLWRTNYNTNGVGDFKIVSANSITNDKPIFSLLNYLGQTNANSLSNRTVGVYLSFTKLQNPQIVIAPGSPVDFYQINTQISWREQ